MIETLAPSKANPDEFDEENLMEEWAGDPAGAHVASQAFNEARINPDVKTLVLREGGKVKGVATYDVDLKRKELHIWWIGTDTGKGYGGKLFREMEEIADKEHVSMSTVPATEESEAWFVKHGFKKDTTVKRNFFVRQPAKKKPSLEGIDWTIEPDFPSKGNEEPYTGIDEFGITESKDLGGLVTWSDIDEIAEDPKYYTVTEIPLDELVAMQGMIMRDGLENYVNNPELIDNEDPDKLPLVILGEDGIYYVSDGHHRFAASKFLGRQSLKIKLVRADLKKPSPYGATAKSRGGVINKKRSKTSGWAKLKEELPSSGAVHARLRESGHSVKYSKVLQSLERYWMKRGN